MSGAAKHFSSEAFWDYLGGNIGAAECAEQIRQNGLTIDEDELVKARREGRAAVCACGGEVVSLPQTNHLAVIYR